MCIWNKVLMGCIAVASVVFFYMAARTVKIHKYWSELAQQHERRISQLQEETRLLREGNGTWMGIAKAQNQLHKLVIDRGRAWFNCTPRQGNTPGQVSVSIEMPAAEADAAAPASLGIPAATVLYVFEKKDRQKGGQYLGEFKVTGVGKKDVQLEPLRKFNEAELQRLTQSGGPWVMYDTMPTDNHEAFAGLTESQLKPLLPAAVLAEYVRDGQPAQPGDPDRCKVAGKYVRALRDYAGMRDTFFQQRTVLVDQIEADKRDQQYVEEALADAKTEVSFFETEKATVQALVKKYAEQRDAVLAHLRRIEKSLADFKAMIAQQLTLNQRMANQIGAIQFKARQIDQQTRVMAQATAGAAH
jgi:hypothetical protein